MSALTINLPSVRFERFELQPHERLLLAEGRPQAIGPRAFDVLVTLVERAGHLVTKAELMDQVWPGLVVEENNIAAQVSALRKVLGGDIIATIPGRGYRFTAVVERTVDTPLPAKSVPATAEAAAPGAPADPAAARPAQQATLAPVTASPLFGRDDDLARVVAGLHAPGCLTLVGAAGMGKTRLAQAFAAQWPQRGVWVDLAALTDAPQVSAALARALDVGLPEGDPQPALARALRDEGTLVVFDNAEHLIDAVAALVAMLRQAAGHVRVLVTSQLPLAVPGERVIRLEPLSLPDAESPFAQALGTGAIALLVDRITAADHRFHATADMLPLLREICTRLDGLPLALEMAAARVPLLGLQGVRDALAQRFALLTTGHRVAPGRHKTLHAALDWSHGLLNDAERRLFRALGVCAGGFTLDMAVALAARDDQDAENRWTVIDRLAVLVERSLVATNRDDPPRYRLLETMRAYALEQLAAAGEDFDVRRRHARAVRDLFERTQAAAISGDRSLMGQCLREVDNAREAIVWAMRHEPVTAIAMSSAVTEMTVFTTWRGETAAWLVACEPLLHAGIDLRIQASWWRELTRHLIITSNPSAPEAARRASDLYRELGDDVMQLRAKATLVRAISEPGAALDAACADLQALLARHSEWGDPPRLVVAGSLGRACDKRGDHAGALEQCLIEIELAGRTGAVPTADAAETNVLMALAGLGRHDEAITRGTALMERIGDKRSGNVPWGWMGLLVNLEKAGRLAELRQQAPRALAAVRVFDLPILTPLLALFAAREGRTRAAAQLIGYARQAFESRGMNIESYLRPLSEAEAIARVALGETAFARLVEEGRAKDDTTADLLVLALDDPA